MHTLIFEQTNTKMRNYLQILLTLLLFFSASLLKAQCPLPSFSSPDSACKGTSVLFSNTSVGSNLSIKWDFNSGDTRNVPTGGISGSFPSDISSTTGVDFFKENNNIIAIALKTSGELARMTYGNSLTNTPTVTNLGNLGVLVGGNRDFVLVKENANYFGLLVNAFGQVYRVEFGSSLLNTPTATQITIPGGTLSTAFNIDVKKMGNDYVALIANNSGANATVINFGPSMTNNSPAAYNIPMPGVGPIATALVDDCGHLYGIVAYVSSSPMTIIDFGTAVSPTPIQVTDLISNSQTAYRKISVIHDGYNWLIAGNSFGGDQLQILDFGHNINNLNPLITYPGTAGAFGSGFWNFSAKKIDSDVGGIACNYNTGDLSWFQFPQTGNVTPIISYDPNPSLSFNDTGKFIITLVVTDTISGNSTSIVDSIYISDAPSASFVSDPSCSLANTIFTSTSSGNPISFSWTFGDGNIGTGSLSNNIYSASGNFDATLIAINSAGCSDTITNTISVNDPPIADFLFANNQCAGAEIIFTDNSSTAQGTVSSWTWVFSQNDTLSGTSSSFQFNADGQYPVQLFIESSTGCIDSVQKYIDIIPGPITSFSSSNTCLGDTVNFINTTTITGGLNVNYEWIFNTNDTSILANPNFAFPSNTAGDYSVFLTGTASNGCVDTVTSYLRIGIPAAVNFVIADDTVCSNSIVQFSDISFIAPGETVLKRIWDFGDGFTDSLLTSISHLYVDSGQYTITLTVQTASNCISTFSKNIIVLSSPISNFGLTNVCEGISVLFSDSSTSSALSPLTIWNWNFGDSTTSTLQNPTHVYLNSGIYNITLTAIDNNGCLDSITKGIDIYPNPLVNFYSSKACTYQSTTFNDSTTTTANLTNWEWNFGDGNVLFGIQNPQHTYTFNAAYPVQLIATTSQGCIDSVTKLIIVDYSPEFTLSPSVACYGIGNNFSFNFNGTPVTNPGYTWDFGDSTASLQAQPSHTYAIPGQKQVYFTLTNLDNGCFTTDSLTAVVVEKPIAQFISDSACIGDTLQLINTSSSLTDPISQWNWTSTIGNLLPSQNQQIVANTVGIYQVKLLVTTILGCKDSTTNTVVVFALPQVNFTTSTNFGSPPLPVTFTNTSEPGNYFWNFGDGSPINNTISPTHNFQDTGKYIVNLTNVSSFGCTSNLSQTIYVLLPYLDLAVVSCNYNETTDAYEATAILQNLGNITIENFNINAYLQSKSPITELTENLSIKPGESFNFKFSTKFLKDDYAPNFLCVEVTRINHTYDNFPSNNESCSTIRTTSEIFDAYPNPSSNSVTIPINALQDKNIFLTIYNVYGQITNLDLEFHIKKGFNRINIDISHLAVGSYIFKIVEGEDVHHQNIIKR